MRLLLDTCTFLWIVDGSAELTSTAYDLFIDPNNEVFLSAISSWEIAVKYQLGRLPLPEPPDRLIPRLRAQHGVAPLPMDEDTTFHLSRLPAVHRDPFDRMLICQAIRHGMAILTPDQAIRSYPVRTLW